MAEGVLVLMVGLVAVVLLSPVLYLWYSGTTNALNQTPAVQTLKPSQQSTLHSLEGNGGVALSMADFTTMMEIFGGVMATMVAVFGILIVKDR